MDPTKVLRSALRLAGKEEPFCWQAELLVRLLEHDIPRALDIPTGLGKTAVMAIWLVARACGGKELPRRLIYIVDRRAVVDQATDEAISLLRFVESRPEVKKSLGLEMDQALPISTLRGQHIDNKKWLENPAVPAIIVGTVDMIGSRLLFEGYGVTRKMRPYHAALLGVDTLVVLDESHLVPPFEKLIESIARRQGCGEGVYDRLGAADADLEQIVPKLRLMSLSATGRTNEGAFGLTEADLKEGTVTRRRLDAKKRLTLHPIDDAAKLVETLAEKAWELCEKGAFATRIVVFCNRRKDALATRDAIRKRANSGRNTSTDPQSIATELFVGGRRVFERERAAERLKGLGFIAGSTDVVERPTFLLATSAAEVGVDLDADHMVCDLVAWERMVQRLGRVNRRGDGDAQVIVVVPPDPKASKPVQNSLDKANSQRTKSDLSNIAKHEEAVKQSRVFRQALELLRTKDGSYDASPGAILMLNEIADRDNYPVVMDLGISPYDDINLRKWKFIGTGLAPQCERHTVKDILEQATTPPPLRPGLSRALVEAWSMTSLKEHTGRPIVAPWLRGWIDDEPQTSVVWRKHLPDRGKLPSAKRSRGRLIRDIEAFFEAAPLHLSEVLETETRHVFEWLCKRAQQVLNPKEGSDSGNAFTRERTVAIVLDHALDVARGDREGILTVGDFIFDPADKDFNQKQKESLERLLYGKTVVVDSEIGGMLDSGLLDDEWDEAPRTADDSRNEEDIWNWERDEPVIKFLVRRTGGDEVEDARESASDMRDPDGNNRESERADAWKERFRFVLKADADVDNPPALVVYKWKGDSSIEDDRSTGFWQSLEDHKEQAEEHALLIASKLGLTGEYSKYATMLAVVARLHDEGKLADNWQRAFTQKAPMRPVEFNGQPLAKTPGPIDFQILNHYRHELGSLLKIEQNANGEYADFHALPADLRELGLHLIAAHHGFARPLITVEGCADAPPSVLEKQAQQIAIRFARLQKRWGPWGLAWWESLLRAADQQASRQSNIELVSATEKA